MKNTLIIAIVCIALGFASGWLIKPETPSEDKAEASTRPASRTSKPSGSRSSSDADKPKSARRSSVTIRSGKSLDEMDPETKKMMEEAQKKQKEMVQKRQKEKFDTRIAAMVKELGLNANQEKALRVFFDKQLKALEEGDVMSMSGDAESMKKLAAALRGDGLNDAMQDVFTDDQMEGLEAMQGRKKNRMIESRAMKNLAKLQGTLDLADDQKDEVYTILVEDAEKALDEQSDANFVMKDMMSSMMGGTGIEMDMGDMDFSSLMALESGGEESSVDKANIIQKMKDDHQKKINAKVERLAPVLNETQLEQYRKSLENKGGMFKMMMQGMESEESE